MIKNIKNISVLVSICVVITVLLAATNAITAPIIEKNQNASANAALLAIQILAVEDAALANKLDASRADGARKVLEKNKAIEEKFNA